MSDQPFRERRIPPEEVQRIVQRALDLAAMDGKPTQGKALTGAELEARLQELGVSPEIARRALEPKAAAIAPSTDRFIRVEREVELEGALSPEHFERVADAIQAAMYVPGRISAVGSKLTWTPGGAMLEPSVTVHAKDGHTVVRYVETLAIRGQLTAGLGIAAGFSAFGSGTAVSLVGAAIAKAADVSAATGAPIVLGTAALIAAAAAIGSFLGLKRSFARRLESRSRFADEVLRCVTRAVQDSLSASTVKARVETQGAARREGQADAELAEAEEEATTREHRR